jgi:Ran GTPase-activating protein (RanGAP) involved in mRNA processing and transport
MDSSSISRIIQRLRSGDESLTRVKLVFPPTKDQLNDLLDLLPESRSVSYVLLERRFVYALSVADFQRTLLAIGLIKGLQELEIWSARVPLSTLCQAIRPATSLRKLGLGFVGMFDLRSCAHLENHPSLNHVYLKEFRLAEEEEADYDTQRDFDPEEVLHNLDAFLRALSTCSALETVEFFSSRADGDPWSPEALATLVESISLRSLTLSRLHLSSAHLLAVANSLATFPNNPLRVLDLSENQIGDHASAAIARSVVAHANLRSLSLRDNSMTGAGCLQLADTLQHNNNGGGNVPVGGLETLNLAGNSICDDGARALAGLLRHQDRPSLQHLELSRGEISDDGCVALANAIQDNTSLISLGLSYNKLKTPSYIAFAQALSTNRTLTSIDLEANGMEIALKGQQAIADMLQENMDLESLKTVFCTVTFDAAVSTFLELNCAGRRNLMRGNPLDSDWIEAISKVNDNLNAIYYLVRAQPSLCGGYN